MATQTRPPVITIMGHVDHGKTTLLDYIRKAKVAAGEAGGITQHIGAYQVEHKHKKLTFIDTPGHAAFNKMRERGANVTDIIILVVAADDGVKPQTIESIRHIKNSTAAVIVAINKVDKENVYPDMVKAQLAEHDILVSGYGGDVETVELSAKTGKGVDALLDLIAVTAELLELTADPTAPLQAVVIESTRDRKRGPVASVIVKQGTLKVRQDIYATDADHQLSRVRALIDEHGKQLKEVTPGSPAEIVGFTEVPAVGALIQDAAAEYPVVSDEPTVADAEISVNASEDEDPFAYLGLDAAFNEVKKLKLIVRADVEGTLEAINQTFDDESVIVIDSGVGQVTSNDIDLAETTGSTILAFHVRIPGAIKEQAKSVGVKIKEYDVIYKLIEDLQKQMLKLMDATIDEVVTGEAEIMQIFEMKGERIAGSKVKSGEIKKTDKIHLKRGDEILRDVEIKAMMHGKQEIDSVKAKNEFGMTFKHKKVDFQVGDMLVAYHEEE